MAYERTVWKNREVEKPRTFRIQNNADGTVTLIPAEGAVNEVGTPIVAGTMNKIENELFALSGKSENWDDVHARYPKECKIISNWNDVSENGMYMGPENTPNAPTNAWYMGTATVHNVNFAVVKAIGVTNGQEYERQMYNGVWESWVETSPRRLFSSVSNGKLAVASAITGKGVATSATAEFATMAANIRSISTGASGTVMGVGQAPDVYLVVTGLAFRPKVIEAYSPTLGRYILYDEYSQSDFYVSGAVGAGATLHTAGTSHATAKSRAVITNGGFSLPIFGTQASYNWRAYE